MLEFKRLRHKLKWLLLELRNRQITHRQPVHSQQICVWCRQKMSGSIFDRTHTQSEFYQDLLVQFIAMLGEDEHFSWFRQDNATWTCSYILSTFWRKTYWKRTEDIKVSRSLSRGWFPLEVLKNRAFYNNPITIGELNGNINSADSRNLC